MIQSARLLSLGFWGLSFRGSGRPLSLPFTLAETRYFLHAQLAQPAAVFPKGWHCGWTQAKVARLDDSVIDNSEGHDPMLTHGSIWRRRFVLACVLTLAVSGLALGGARLPEDRGAAGLWRTLLELRTTASALHITAHPDDEDGATLTLLARGQGVRTMLLSLNRGEGGANLIAPFFFDELGVLRTLELLQTNRYYGAQVFFTHLVDYGYSKTLDEALGQWGGEEAILRAVTRVVRRERPDVIISRFRGDRHDGHGHHQAAGLIAQQAFEAAADPNRFPEQLAEGLRPWRAKKLYINNIRPDRRPEDKELVTLAVNSGAYDPLLGRSYAQIAGEGLRFQRSQGAGRRARLAGPYRRFYHLVKTRLPGYAAQREETFFDGLDTSILGIAKFLGIAKLSGAPAWLSDGLQRLHAAVEAAISAFDARAPEHTVPSLAAGLTAARALLEHADINDQLRFLLARKEMQFQKALSQALGLDIEVAVSPGSSFNHAIPGQQFDAQLRVVNRSGVAVAPSEAALSAPDGWRVTASPISAAPLQNNDALMASFSVQVADNAEFTRPYWRRDSIQEAVYTIDRQDEFTYPLPPPPVWGVAQLSAGGVTFTIKAPLRITRRDPRTGPSHPTLAVVPAISVRFPVAQGVLPIGKQDYEVTVIVRSNVKGPAQGEVRLKLPAGWSSAPASHTFAFANEDEEAAFDFTVQPAADVRQEVYAIKAVATYEGNTYAEGFVTVAAPDVGRFNFYRPARHELRGVDVNIAAGLRVGYVMGSGDGIPQSLALLGVQPDMLGPTDLAAADLNQYDTIILGVRAYAARPDVKTYNGRLLDYVKNGGVLIVQYQTPEFDHNYGPYPYSQTRRPEEVSEENAVVTILEPAHPIFQTPNFITAKDFDGWVEQRGSKFMKTWDMRYTALLECHDQGQAPQRGGMLYAEYGKGVYVYSAYAWYRQLPHGVPGAFRIYANMLSLGKRRDRQ